MPRNDVLERMALQCRRHDVAPVLRGKTWAELGVPPEEREIYYREALELLGIVEEDTEPIDNACFDGPASKQKSVWMTDGLFEVFQLAREAREEKK